MTQYSSPKTLSELPTRLEGPEAWYGPQLSAEQSWLHPLSEQEIGEIRAAVLPLVANDVEFAAITRETFPLPRLGPRLAEICDAVTKGCGFALLRGLPVETWTRRELAVAFFGIGTYFGNVRAQNAKGHILGHVKDLGRDAEKDPTARVYQTAERQTFHTDRSDIVALLCLQTAKSGGASSLVSSVTIYNEIHKRAPELLPVLFQPFAVDRRGEEAPGQKGYSLTPVFTWHEGYLSAYFLKRYIESAVRFDDVAALTDEQRAAIELVDELANDPALNMHLQLEPGDMEWVYNHTTLHDRTAYEDWPEDHRKRHLLRLWLSVPGDRPLPDIYSDRWGGIEPGERGGVQVPAERLSAPLAAV